MSAKPHWRLCCNIAHLADAHLERGLPGVLRGLHHELDALAAQGDTVGAKEKFAKALELEPRNPAFQKYKDKAKL